MSEPTLSVKDLQDFEKEVAQMFKDGKIRAPIHLRDGNEDELIKVFKEITPNDYVFCTWASHMQALLHGVPKKRILDSILAGQSITLMFPEYNFYSSAIVGGILPIAVGTAWAIQCHQLPQTVEKEVFCFVGDMAYLTGIARESIRYANNFDLPITFIVEDNNKSVMTPTDEAWGNKENAISNQAIIEFPRVHVYEFDNTYPHSGIGKFVSF